MNEPLIYEPEKKYMPDLKIPGRQEVSPGRTSFGKREKVVINLLVSQINESSYCVAQHTEEAWGFDLSAAQIDEIKNGAASFDPKLDALSRLTKELVEKKGKPSRELLAAFYKAGYNYGHVVDLTVAIGEKTIANYICNIAQPPIDFPITDNKK
jgi:AhpD family alkylhydroperoxidase